MLSVTKWIRTVGNGLFPTLVALPDAVKPQHTISITGGSVFPITSPLSFPLPTAHRAVLDGNLLVTITTNRSWREHAAMEGMDVGVTISSNGITIFHVTLPANEIIAKEAAERLKNG